jgi:hypothetical protein
MPASPELLSRLERIAHKRITYVQSIQRGYTPALRLKVGLSDGSSVFAKVGVNEMTAGWLRQERRVYESLNATFMPRCLGWDDDGVAPILLLEDLSDAHWPPPWTEAQIRRVVDTMPAVWDSTVPGLPDITEFRAVFTGWEQVASDPAPFLSLQLVTERWLDSALPVLLGVNGRALVTGNSLLHCDLRSDNLCIRGVLVILIDWNLVCRGNPQFDLGFWLPSLEAEGGPRPETILPDAGEVATVVSGFFAARAGLPLIPNAPYVRHIQQVQLKTALPWAVRSMGLPPPDGTGH